MTTGTDLAATAALSLEAGLSLSYLSSFLGPPHKAIAFPLANLDRDFRYTGP